MAGDFARDAAARTSVPPDLLQFWYAARVLLQGGDPYAAIGPGLAFDYPYPLVYPLHAAVAFLPLAPLPAEWAHALVMGLGVFALSWALMEYGWASCRPGTASRTAHRSSCRGLLVLAALSRRRRMDARLLVALACVPHTTLPHEMVPLFLVPRGWAQCASLVSGSLAMWGSSASTSRSRISTPR